MKTIEEIKKYIESRMKTIQHNIAVEELAGNTVKSQCEKTALAEIEALRQELLR